MRMVQSDDGLIIRSLLLPKSLLDSRWHVPAAEICNSALELLWEVGPEM